VKGLDSIASITYERLKALHEARPFKPFGVYLADGRTIPVHHPEMLARNSASRTFVIDEAEDKIHFVDLLLVTNLVVGENGRSRSRRQ
jgi:hypothetical protein